MNNYINYYYGIDVDKYKKSKDNYYFKIKDKDYCFKCYDGSLNELLNILDFFYYKRIYCHEIIKNRDNNIISVYNNKEYILIKKNMILDSDITINELFTTNVYTGFSRILNWRDLWIKKIDYYEYQITELSSNNEELNYCFNYFIGLSENAIELLNLVNNVKYNLYVSHKRITLKNKVDDLYDPTNIIFDTFVRDLAEYIKFYFVNEKLDLNSINEIINNINFTKEEAIAFFSRVLYPSYFWDVYDEFIINKNEENIINKIIKKSSNIELLLKDIYSILIKRYDFPKIDWLQTRY